MKSALNPIFNQRRTSRFLLAATAVTILLSAIVNSQSVQASTLYPDPCKNKNLQPNTDNVFNPSDPQSSGSEFAFNPTGEQRSIPESSSVLSLIGLGTIGVVAFLKRPAKNKLKEASKAWVGRLRLYSRDFSRSAEKLPVVSPKSVIDRAEDGEIQWVEFFKT